MYKRRVEEPEKQPVLFRFPCGRGEMRDQKIADAPAKKRISQAAPRNFRTKAVLPGRDKEQRGAGRGIDIDRPPSFSRRISDIRSSQHFCTPLSSFSCIIGKKCGEIVRNFSGFCENSFHAARRGAIIRTVKANPKGGIFPCRPC